MAQAGFRQASGRLPVLSKCSYGSHSGPAITIGPREQVTMTESREIDLAVAETSTPQPELLCISDSARPIFLVWVCGERERERERAIGACNNSGSKSLPKPCCFPSNASMIIGGFVAAGQMGGRGRGRYGSAERTGERERERERGE